MKEKSARAAETLRDSSAKMQCRTRTRKLPQKNPKSTRTFTTDEHRWLLAGDVNAFAARQRGDQAIAREAPEVPMPVNVVAVAGQRAGLTGSVLHVAP
jgi:hypothetical protein